MIKNKIEINHRISNESKNTYTDCIDESEAFQFFKCYFYLKIEKI